jgi:hypothetical protein
MGPTARRRYAPRPGITALDRWQALPDVPNLLALRRLICLCTDCHTTTHFGLASINGKSTEAFKHLCTITGLPEDQVSQHIDAAFALWRRHSAIAWELDLSILVRAGVAVTKPPSATEHADLPSKILRRI